MITYEHNLVNLGYCDTYLMLFMMKPLIGKKTIIFFYNSFKYLLIKQSFLRTENNSAF